VNKLRSQLVFTIDIGEKSVGSGEAAPQLSHSGSEAMPVRQLASQGSLIQAHTNIIQQQPSPMMQRDDSHAATAYPKALGQVDPRPSPMSEEAKRAADRSRRGEEIRESMRRGEESTDIGKFLQTPILALAGRGSGSNNMMAARFQALLGGGGSAGSPHNHSQGVPEGGSFSQGSPITPYNYRLQHQGSLPGEAPGLNTVDGLNIKYVPYTNTSIATLASASQPAVPQQPSLINHARQTIAPRTSSSRGTTGDYIKHNLPASHQAPKSVNEPQGNCNRQPPQLSSLDAIRQQLQQYR